ncbi:hypothetical protein CEXT_11561 [Caerostris extrusa]|uniref:Maturase K n=1 Tax=Caerostris extrusa TaxID=172846 RepID=A0AAV4XCQ0_CAEEX|nr:hypothetical protein CEXT_11561 [Caerostris extrusa]
MHTVCLLPCSKSLWEKIQPCMLAVGAVEPRLPSELLFGLYILISREAFFSLSRMLEEIRLRAEISPEFRLTFQFNYFNRKDGREGGGTPLKYYAGDRDFLVEISTDLILLNEKNLPFGSGCKPNFLMNDFICILSVSPTFVFSYCSKSLWGEDPVLHVCSWCSGKYRLNSSLGFYILISWEAFFSLSCMLRRYRLRAEISPELRPAFSLTTSIEKMGKSLCEEDE